MGPLGKYLNIVLQLEANLAQGLGRKSIKSDFEDAAVQVSPQLHGRVLSRIFQPTEHELRPSDQELDEDGQKLTEKVKEVFNRAAAILEKEIMNFNPYEGQVFQQLDPLIDTLLKELAPDLIAVMDGIPIRNATNRALFVRDVGCAYIFKLITDLSTPVTKISRDVAEALRIAATTRGKPMPERLQKLAEKIPTVRPTVCYFPGKKDKTFFGHVAVGLLTEQLPHGLVLCDKPPPLSSGSNEEKKAGEEKKAERAEVSLEKYLLDRRISPQHNAFLVAGQGSDLHCVTIKPDKSKVRPEDILAYVEDQTILTRSVQLRQGDGRPVLIRCDNELFLFGNTPKTSKWKLIPLTGKISAQEKQALLALFTDDKTGEATLEDGNPKLAGVIEILKKFHAVKSNVFYLSRNNSADPITVTRVAREDEILDPFKKKYVKECLSPNESARYLALLTPEEFRDTNAMLRHPVPRFASYLTYGATDRQEAFVETGVGGDIDLRTEQRVYADKPRLLTLPPCARKDFEDAQREFAGRNRREYGFTGKNCVNAVYDFMKTTRHFAHDEDLGRGAPRPGKCADRVCKLIKEDLEKSRQQALKNTLLPPVAKVCRLIGYEIQRLETRKSPASEKVTQKIDTLKVLLSHFKTLPSHLSLDALQANQEGRRKLEAAIAFMRTQASFNPLGKRQTAQNLQDCLDACFNKPKAAEEKRGVDIGAPGSFLDNRPPPPVFPLPATIDTGKWHSVAGNGQSQYRYIMEDSPDLRRTLREALVLPVQTSDKVLPFTPSIAAGKLRLSTHPLPDAAAPNGLRFGLLEKCLTPGQSLNSEIIPPMQTPSIDQWLLMIDRQVAESNKVLGKPCTALTINTLELKELEDTARPPIFEFFEIAYMQYCLAERLTYRVKNGDKETVLSRDFLKTLMKKIAPGFDAEALHYRLQAARGTLDSERKEEKQSFLNPAAGV